MKFTSLLCPYFLVLVGVEDEFLLAKLNWQLICIFFPSLNSFIMMTVGL